MEFWAAQPQALCIYEVRNEANENYSQDNPFKLHHKWNLLTLLYPYSQAPLSFLSLSEHGENLEMRLPLEYIDHQVPSGIKERHRHGHKFAFEAESKQTGLASLANRYMHSRCLIPRSPPFVCYISVCVHNNNYSVTMIHCPLTDL